MRVARIRYSKKRKYLPAMDEGNHQWVSTSVLRRPVELTAHSGRL